MKNVFVCGSINVDLVFTVDHLPKQGETLTGEKFFMAPGGKGANQAVACAKQDLPTWMIGSVGDDPLASLSISSLQHAGVHINYVKKNANQHTGVAGIFLSDGDNRIVLGPGANTDHDIKQITSILDQESQPGDILLCQLEIPILVVQRVVEYASSKGLYVVLNAAPASALPDELLQTIDLLIVNEIELATLAKQDVTDKESVRSATSLLLKQVNAILVTLGKDGSFYKNQSEEHWCQAYPVDIVDTTAAGDTFIGAYLRARQDQKPIPKRLQYASASAALAIQTLGAQPSIPSREEVLEFLQKEGKMNE